jgi:RNA polymerase sigma-70 factor (ECF subfamily)
MSTYSDEQLVLEALDDSHLAFEQLVTKHQYRVLRTIASIIGDEQVAQDVAQETFLAAWSNLRKLKEKQKFAGWVTKIAINLSKMWLRNQHQYRENKVSFKEDLILRMQELRYQRNQLRQQVWEAIDELAESHREVVILRYISGYSYKEISEMLSVPVSTVSGRLQKAKNQLRKEFLDMVTQLQLEIDSKVHKFLKQRAKQDGVPVEGLILRLIERYKRDTDSPGMTVRKLEDCGWKWRYTGGPSPDGRYFSFMTWDGNLVVRDLTTGEERDVINDGNRNPRKPGPKRSCEASTWSPDSKQIAYQWKSDDCNELRIIGLDGSKPRVLYRSEEPALGIRPWDWSQDGKFILGGRGESDRYASCDIVLISVADGSMRTLKSPKEHEWLAFRMCLSPDGRYVAYARAAEKYGNLDVFLLATDGSGEEVRLSGHTDSGDGSPVWAPDGKSIVFRYNRGPEGNTSLWLTRVADGRPKGEPQLVMEFVGYVHPKGFTREGSLYYDISSAPRGHIYVASLDMETGEVESQPTRIRCEGPNWNPAWSPDGKSLAYMSGRDSPKKARGPTLVIRSMETGKEREIHIETFVAAAIPLRWSPDGRSILCGNWSNPILIDVQTDNVTIMEFHRGMKVWYPEWSRDGKTIFYNFCHSDKEAEFSRIGAYDLGTGKHRELYTGGNGESYLVVSPDGQELAFTFSDKGYKALKVIPTAGGEAGEILGLRNEGGESFEHVSPVAWTPDGRYLLFVRGKHSSDGSRIGLQELWRISAEGGESQKLMELESGLRMSSLHPDGQRIVYAEMGPEYRELWVMENLLATFAADK